MKYICTNEGMMEYRLFGDHEKHSDVAEEVGKKVLSAGFVGIDDTGSPYAYGKSTSLNIESQPEIDTPWLRLIWPK